MNEALVVPLSDTERSELEVHKLLPQTSCRDCGQPTCYTFALKLAMGHVRLEDCPALREPRYEQQRAQLDALLPSGMPAIGSQA